MLLPFHCSELCLLSWLCRSFVCPLPFTRWRDPALFDALSLLPRIILSSLRLITLTLHALDLFHQSSPFRSYFYFTTLHL